MIITPNFKRIVAGLGLVRDDHKGDLIIKFIIQFPKHISKDNIKKLLDYTYQSMFIQAKKIINKLVVDECNLKILIKKNNNLKWSNKIKSFDDLNKFYKINLNCDKKEFLKKIKATNTDNFKPYIIFHGKKFLYND